MSDTASVGGLSNRMEILLFSLGTSEIFGINVFKIREVCNTMEITRTPGMPQAVEGVVSLRGHIIPILNLPEFLGFGAASSDKSVMMIAEYSKHVLAFLVHSVDHIISVDVSRIRTTEGMLQTRSDIVTAITELDDGRLVSIIDVEQVLSAAFGEDVVGAIESAQKPDASVFFVDDSSVARKKITEVLDKMGVRHHCAHNGVDALAVLKGMAEGHRDIRECLNVIMLDAEMPEMDGYTLAETLRSDARFQSVPIIMHSSLSSTANKTLWAKSGASHFVEKFDAITLANAIRSYL